MVKIRTAEEKDAQRVIRLLGQIAALHHKGRPDVFKPGASKYTTEQFKEKLKDKDSPIFVAVDAHDEVMGYCFCIINRHQGHFLFQDSIVLYIDDFCVDESLRGQGIGKTLFAAVHKYAQGIGAHRIELNVWVFNEEAVQFYKGLGFATQCHKLELML